MNNSKYLYLTFILFSIAFIPRAFYLGIGQSYRTASRSEMERAALSWARDGRIGDVYSDDSGDSAHVAPLYPILLGSVYRILGGSGTEDQLAQAFLATTATSLGIALLPIVAIKSRLPIAVGIAASIIMATSPVNLWIETSGSWEQPFSALALQGMLIIFTNLHDRRWRSWSLVIIAGLILGACALLSPTLLPAGGAMILAGAASIRRDRRHLVLATVTILSLAAVVVIPWTIRNYRSLGGFVPLRSNFGLELWIGNNPKSNGRTFVTSWDDSNSRTLLNHPLTSDRELAKLIRVGELRYMREKLRLADRWIREHPGEFAALTLRRFMLFWFPPREMWAPSTTARGLKSFVMILTGVGALCGMARLFLASHVYRWLILGALSGPSLIYLITHVDPRYRYSIFWLSVLLTCDFARAVLKAGIRDLGRDRAVPEEQYG